MRFGYTYPQELNWPKSKIIPLASEKVHGLINIYVQPTLLYVVSQRWTGREYVGSSNRRQMNTFIGCKNVSNVVGEKTSDFLTLLEALPQRGMN